MSDPISFAQFISQLFTIAGTFFGATWWFFAFIILIPMTRSAVLGWRQQHFIEHSKWTLLQMKIPRENLRNPRAMDQFFQAIHALRNTPSDWTEKYIDGDNPRPFTFEIVSFGGEISFYCRCYYKIRSLFEAAFFSAYPDVELVEAEDYMKRLPHTAADVHAGGFSLWGTEMLLNRPSIYPIKTYLAYESPDENLQLDPMAALIEVLGKVKKDEFFGIQINAVPGDTKEWREHCKHELEKLRESKKGKANDAGFAPMIMKSPGETEVLKQVEQNLAKPVFECAIRCLYISPNSEFYDSFARRGFLGTFNQYQNHDLNGFKQNVKIATSTNKWYFPYVFPDLRAKLREQRLMQNYIHREAGIHSFMGKLISSHPLNWNFASEEIELNSEALATLYHPPTNIVMMAPHTQKVESKKSGPPAGVPIFGEEKELEGFL